MDEEQDFLATWEKKKEERDEASRQLVGMMPEVIWSSKINKTPLSHFTIPTTLWLYQLRRNNTPRWCLSSHRYNVGILA